MSVRYIVMAPVRPEVTTMHELDLAVPSPPLDPEPILLEQLTMLAAASIAPAPSPWWRRAATKSGAAAMVGVIAISGTAYAAQRGVLTPIIRSVVGMPSAPALVPPPPQVVVQAVAPRGIVTPRVLPRTHPEPSEPQVHLTKKIHGHGWAKHEWATLDSDIPPVVESFRDQPHHVATQAQSGQHPQSQAQAPGKPQPQVAAAPTSATSTFGASLAQITGKHGHGTARGHGRG